MAKIIDAASLNSGLLRLVVCNPLSFNYFKSFDPLS
jgi:hypothetical protein